MNINKLIKKQAFLSLISLALIAFIVTGSSYALFSSTVVDSGVHNVTTPNFVISYLNKNGSTLTNSDALNIDDLVSLDDATALSSTTNIYKYKISNTGTIPYRFKTYIKQNPSYASSNQIDLYYIKYETNSEKVKTLASSLGKNITTNILVFPNETEYLTPNVNDIINPGQTKEFYIRLWLRNDVDLPNDILGKEIHLQLVIEGESVSNADAAPKGWNTSSTGTLLAALKTNNPLTIPQTQIGESPTITTKLSTTESDGTELVYLSELAGQSVGVATNYCKYCSQNLFDSLVILSNTDMSSSLKGKYISYANKVWYVNGFKSNVSGDWMMFLSLQDTSATSDESTFAGTEDSFGISYYYRGKATNNFVSFAGMCWRIVRIEGNGNIKLTLYNRDSTSCTATGTNLAFIPGNVYDGTTYYFSEFNTSSNDNAYVGYKYGTTSSSNFSATHYPLNDSNVLTKLKTWYDSKLKNYDSYLADSVWCNDKQRSTSGTYAPYTTQKYDKSSFTNSYGYGTNITLFAASTRNMKSSTLSTSIRYASDIGLYQAFANIDISNAKPTLKCEVPEESNIVSNFTSSQTKEGNSALGNYKIGLLTLDEVIYAGGSLIRPNTKYYLMENATNTGSTLMNGWWTLTPAGYYNLGDGNKARMYYVNAGSSGLIDETAVDMTLGIRPAISLKPTVKISGGNGTSSSPYVISSAN